MKLLALLFLLPALCQGQSAGAKCKGGWFLIGNQCFKMMPRAMKWADAELMCEQNAPCGVPVLGGIMSITDPRTQNDVASYLRSISSTGRAIDVPFWTGLRNYWNQVLERYEGWKWPSGYSTQQQPLPYVNWAPREPNLQLLDQQHSYCAAMNPRGQWYVVRCDEPFYFMCSMPVNPPLPGIGRGAGQGPAGRGPAMLLGAGPAQELTANHVKLENGLYMREGVGN